jgi:hypothetical protein
MGRLSVGRLWWTGLCSVVAASFFSGGAAAQNELDMLHRDARVFVAFCDAKMDSLKEALSSRDKAQIKALEERVHDEECRFLERAIWCCRQQRSLGRAGGQLQSYLDSYRTKPLVARVKARIAAGMTGSEVHRFVMERIDGTASALHTPSSTTERTGAVVVKTKKRVPTWRVENVDEESPLVKTSAAETLELVKRVTGSGAASSTPPVGLVSGTSSSPLALVNMDTRASGIKPTAKRR